MTIPGNVKTIETYAFSRSDLAEITIEDGVETIADYAFYNGNVITDDMILHIPKSVISIGYEIASGITGYDVDPANPNYCSEDGILYSKDRTQLVDVPRCKELDEYRVPDSVTTVLERALCDLTRTKKIYVPSTVETLRSSFACRDRNAGNAFNTTSTLQEVYIEDGVTLTGAVSFQNCYQIRNIRLPEDTPINFTSSFPGGYEYSGLEELVIPQGTTTINLIQPRGTGMHSLAKVTYDAENANITNAEVFYGSIDAHQYSLVIGPDVKNLPANFSDFTYHAYQVTFTPNTHLTVADGALKGAGAPLSGVSGPIYVDENGIVYTYDEDAQTAKVAYCPPGLENVTIPAAIPSESEVPCTVTAVGESAFSKAQDVNTITFTDPSKITELADRAFADCPVSSLNGKDNVDDAAASFPNAQRNIGKDAFTNTQLNGQPEKTDFAANMSGKKNLEIAGANGKDPMYITVTSASGTQEWQSKKGQSDPEVGGYHLLTGDVAAVNIAVQNTSGESANVYRVYFQKTDDDMNLTAEPGKSYTYNGQEVTCKATDDPNTIYLEFIPNPDGTVSVPINAVYPSPGSDGGGLTVWGTVQTVAEAQATEGKVVKSQNGVIEQYWDTIPDHVGLKKVTYYPGGYNANTGAPYVQAADGTAKPASVLYWGIQLPWAEDFEDHTLGKDFVRSIEFTDVMTLPEDQSVVWSDLLRQSITDGTLRYVYAGGAQSTNYIYAGTVLLFGVHFAVNNPRLSRCADRGSEAF